MGRNLRPCQPSVAYPESNFRERVEKFFQKNFMKKFEGARVEINFLYFSRQTKIFVVENNRF
jgi:hypothetical protein